MSQSDGKSSSTLDFSLITGQKRHVTRQGGQAGTGAVADDWDVEAAGEALTE